MLLFQKRQAALIAQLGERQTEDLKAPCSIHGQSTVAFCQFSTIFIETVGIFLSFSFTAPTSAFCKFDVPFLYEVTF